VSPERLSVKSTHEANTQTTNKDAAKLLKTDNLAPV
jgi:hypothetical protein